MMPSEAGNLIMKKSFAYTGTRSKHHLKAAFNLYKQEIMGKPWLRYIA